MLSSPKIPKPELPEPLINFANRRNAALTPTTQYFNDSESTNYSGEPWLDDFPSDSPGLTFVSGYGGLINSDEVNRREVTELASILRDNNVPVTSLLLGGSDIDDAGAKALADFLRTTTTLKVLDVHYSHIPEQGMRDLIDALKVNTSVTHLNIRSNALTKEIYRSLVDLFINHNFSIRKLCIVQRTSFPAQWKPSVRGETMLHDLVKRNARNAHELHNHVKTITCRELQNTYRQAFNMVLQRLSHSEVHKQSRAALSRIMASVMEANPDEMMPVSAVLQWKQQLQNWQCGYYRNILAYADEDAVCFDVISSLFPPEKYLKAVTHKASFSLEHTEIGYVFGNLDVLRVALSRLGPDSTAALLTAKDRCAEVLYHRARENDETAMRKYLALIPEEARLPILTEEIPLEHWTVPDALVQSSVAMITLVLDALDEDSQIKLLSQRAKNSVSTFLQVLGAKHPDKLIAVLDHFNLAMQRKIAEAASEGCNPLLLSVANHPAALRKVLELTDASERLGYFSGFRRTNEWYSRFTLYSDMDKEFHSVASEMLNPECIKIFLEMIPPESRLAALQQSCSYDGGGVNVFTRYTRNTAFHAMAADPQTGHGEDFVKELDKYSISPTLELLQTMLPETDLVKAMSLNYDGKPVAVMLAFAADPAREKFLQGVKSNEIREELSHLIADVREKELARIAGFSSSRRPGA